MFPKLRRFGGAALLIAASAAPGFAQEQNREKFVIAGSANKVERSDAVAEAPKGRKIAIVIAVSDYERDREGIPDLPYVENDARHMIETLFNDGFDVWPLCEKDVRLPKAKQDDQPEQKRLARLKKRLNEPTKKNIEATVADALEAVDKDDVVFVYFSGHGENADEDATHLVVKDSNYESLETLKRTSVALSDLRGALANSASRFCLVSLDCCHAGGTRSVASFDEFEHYVEGGPSGVTTLASCALDETSDGWKPIVEDPNDVADDRAVSIFTYWLDAGLKGFADGAIDGAADGKIGSDELFEYVDDNAAFHRAKQTSYVVAKRDAKPFVVCDVKPMKYDEAMDSVARQLVTKAKFMGRDEIVLNVEAVGDEDWEGDAKAVDGLNSFAVGANNYLQKNVDAMMEDLGDFGDKTSNGSVDVDATVELVEREIVDDENGEAKTIREYVLTCRFEDAKAKGRADEVKARILPKNAGETFANDARPAGSISIGDPSAAPSAPPVAKPVENPTVAFTAPEVTVETTLDGGQSWQKRPIYRGSDGANWVELNPGETYRVVVQPSNYGGNPENVGLRLLIDGRNTLPQAELQLYAGTRSAVPQPVARLDSARWWSLRLAEGGVYDAFYRAMEKDENGGSFNAAGNAFQVASASAVGGSTGQNGMIDVAFYALKPTDGTRAESDVLTKEGGETFKVFEARYGMEIDCQLACFRLRYASASRLAELGVDASGLFGAAVATSEPSAPRSEYAGTRGANRSKEMKTGKKRNDVQRETTPGGVLR